MKDVQCLGAATLDTILSVDEIPAMGTKVLAKSMVQLGAGMASSAAAAIARLGGSTGIWSRIGDDSSGDQYLADLESEGVDVSEVRRIRGGTTGIGVTIVGPDGERMIVPFYDPDLEQSVGWLPLEKLETCSALLVDVRWQAGSAAALAAARARGVVTILDADTAPLETLRDLVPRADHAIFSAPGLRTYSETKDPADGLRMARENCAGIVGVTLGAEGFMWLDGGEVQTIPAPLVDVVDTLSAGDVFHGAYALAISRGQSVAAAGRYACAAAAIKCTRFGGRAGSPTAVEVEALLAESGGGAG